MILRTQCKDMIITPPSVMTENYENEIELGETYIRKRLSTHFDVTAGRPVAVWGKADFFRVVDLFNPIDNRERGLNDIEFKRLPLWMTKLDSYFTPWQIFKIDNGWRGYRKSRP